MFYTFRFIFLAVVVSSFITACGNNNNSDTAKKAEQAAPSTAVSSEKVQTVAAGTTEKEAIAKLGQPDLTQTRKIDALTVTYDEWHTDAGILAAQFHNGVAKYSQFIPKTAK